nr:MFS transporter [Pseudonocardia sp.]
MNRHGTAVERPSRIAIGEVRDVRSWVRVAAGLFAIGYGANQFSPLMVAYREQEHFSAVMVAAFFGVYAAGLAPGLLLGGPASDRWGRRRLMLPALAVSAPASAVLALGALPSLSEPALYVGRFLFGVVTGVAMVVGTSWVKELSQPPHDAADPGAGARRAALALSAGFGIGPLVGGLLARFGPFPLEMPYVAHIVITVVVLAVAVGAPDTGTDLAPVLRVRVHLPRRFLRVVLPMAPWVFGAVAISFAVQPAALGAGGGSLLFATLLAALTQTTGVCIQSWARRLDSRSPVLAARVGLGAVLAGTVVAAAAAALGSPVLAVPASLVLGAGYGLCLVAGLLEVQRMAEPEHLAGLTAVFYSLTYVGFLLPVLLAALTGLVGYPVLLAGLAVLVALSFAVVVRNGRSAPVLESVG